MPCSGVGLVGMGKGGTLRLTIAGGGGTVVGQPLRGTNGEATVRAGTRLELELELSTNVSVWDDRDRVATTFGWRCPRKPPTGAHFKPMIVFVKQGRTRGENTRRLAASEADGIALFERKFREKTGNEWDARRSFVKKEGKYGLDESLSVKL